MTGAHRFFSVSRGEWIAVENLRIRELLKNIGRRSEVAAIRRIPGVHRVYNLTVEEDHVFHVGTFYTLVHNNYGGLGNLVKQAKRKISYKRPSGFRKGKRDTVWENAKGEDGFVRDPQTKAIMNKNDAWNMGHKPGYEFRKHAKSAQNRNISRKQFLNEHNTTKHYRPELPSSNRNHFDELGDDIYHGF